MPGGAEVIVILLMVGFWAALIGVLIAAMLKIFKIARDTSEIRTMLIGIKEGIDGKTLPPSPGEAGRT